ncbi:MAG: LpqB family beta-propeller domain-containing protein [Actinomycetota bacterium]
MRKLMPRFFWQMAVVVLVLISGCRGLPDSGPAGPGQDVKAVNREPLGVLPLPPRIGAEPREIVAGFLGAGVDFTDGHAAARLFLAGSETQWNPSRQTIVYESSRALEITQSGKGNTRTVVVQVPVWGLLSSQGDLDLMPSGEVAQQRFTLARVDGEWRIQDFDGDKLGLWLNTNDFFNRAYTPVRLAFTAPGTSTLIPVLRWFPGNRNALPTTVAASLLDGPPGYLSGSVGSGIPPGTTLAVDAVPTSAGVATVDLSRTALRASPEQRQQVWHQVGATLRQLPTVGEVVLTVEGVPYQIDQANPSPVDSRVSFTDNPQVVGPPLVLHDGKVQWVERFSGRLVPEYLERYGSAPRELTLRSMAADQGAIVGVNSNGQRLVSSRDKWRQALITGKELCDPAVDRAGWVWTADREVEGRLQMIPTVGGRKPISLAPEWLLQRSVLALDVSREGTRVAVLSRDRRGVITLDIAGIVRNAAGQPVELGSSRTIARPLPAIKDVTWTGDDGLVVLADGSPNTVHYVEIGGRMSPLPAIPPAERIRAGSSQRELYLLTSQGKLLARDGNKWNDLGAASALAIPS